MYIPEHFKMSEADTNAFLETVRAGTLITIESGRPVASFIPLTLVGGDRLTSHIGKVNPHNSCDLALIILMSEDAYVSHDWMSPGIAPSWNYETVHLYGKLTIHTDPDWIIASFDDMLRRFSHSSNDDYEPDWLEKQARACHGVEFEIVDIQAKSKLSQNRSEADVRTIADHLESSNPHLASRMREVSLPHIVAREARVSQARNR